MASSRIINPDRLITRRQWNRLDAYRKGAAVYLQAELPGSPLKGLTNPFPRDSRAWLRYQQGATAAAIAAQDHETD